MTLASLLSASIASYQTREWMVLLALGVALFAFTQASKWKWQKVVMVAGGALVAIAWVIPLPEGIQL